MTSETGFDPKLYDRFPTQEPRPDGELKALEAVWCGPKGWGWFTAINNSYVGILFVGAAFLFFVLAGILALVMRTQLAVPDAGFVGVDTYNQLFTMHGTVMMFLFAVPMVEAMAVLLLPQMLGARDLPFPRLGAYALWSYVVGGLIFFSSIFFSLAPDGGWFMYPPLTNKAFSPGINTDFWLLGIGFIEISAIAGAIEIVVGVMRTRAPGMTLARLPIRYSPQRCVRPAMISARTAARSRCCARPIATSSAARRMENPSHEYDRQRDPDHDDARRRDARRRPFHRFCSARLRGQHHVRRNEFHHQRDAERNQHEIVEIPEHRNEVGNEVDRTERIRRYAHRQHPHRQRRARIARREVHRQRVSLQRTRLCPQRGREGGHDWLRREWRVNVCRMKRLVKSFVALMWSLAMSATIITPAARAADGPDPEMLALAEGVARFIETLDAADINGVFADRDVAIIENFAPYRFDGPRAVDDWAAGMRAHREATADLHHSFGPPQDYSRSGDRAFFALPTTWTGTFRGTAFVETGGWAFVLTKQSERLARAELRLGRHRHIHTVFVNLQSVRLLRGEKRHGRFTVHRRIAGRRRHRFGKTRRAAVAGTQRSGRRAAARLSGRNRTPRQNRSAREFRQRQRRIAVQRVLVDESDHVRRRMAGDAGRQTANGRARIGHRSGVRHPR